jgi:hypothetical protein
MNLSFSLFLYREAKVIDRNDISIADAIFNELVTKNSILIMLTLFNRSEITPSHKNAKANFISNTG